VRVIAQDVHHTYPHQREPVLRGVDFEIPSGASAAIVGPSGSGKTTLLSLMGELLHLQRGRIVALDADGKECRVRDTASWVLQTVSLLGDRTAADNVAVGAYSDAADRLEARRRAFESLAAVGLTGRENDIARILSGGEAQRVAIARALASHRPVILADEPTGQLDATTSAVVLDAMIGAHGGRTIVVVTHDLEIAERCDVILELRDGRVHERART
jgi:ABC-type lipoprotein export system ATPase subunit